MRATASILTHGRLPRVGMANTQSGRRERRARENDGIEGGVRRVLYPYRYIKRPTPPGGAPSTSAGRGGGARPPQCRRLRGRRCLGLGGLGGAVARGGRA